MPSYSEKSLGVETSKDGSRLLKGKRFKGNQFDELMFGPLSKSSKAFLIEDCVFEKCKVGPFLVFPGVELRNVRFDSIRTTDGITISSGAVLDRVEFTGKHSGAVWIKPFEAELTNNAQITPARITNSAHPMVDIANLTAPEVEILGLPAERVVINPEKHVVLRRRKVRPDWNSMRIPSSSLWRLSFARLDDFNVDIGIYDIPDAAEDVEAFEEFELLRSKGLF